MLHHVFIVFIAFLIPLNGLGIETKDLEFFDITSASQQRELNEKLASMTVRVRRARTTSPRLRVPGQPFFEFQGWRLAKGRVLTASVAVSGRGALGLEVFDGKAWKPATIGLIDTRQGVAVLDVDITGLNSKQMGDPVLEQPFCIGLGRVLFAVLPDGQFIRAIVRAKGGAPFEYFYQLSHRFPLGTPLTDAKGRLLSLVGHNFDAASGGWSHGLPVEAFKWLMEQKIQWAP